MTTTTFTTKGGSLYEIDTRLKRIRRVTGSHEPTGRQGNDGDWQDYDNAFITHGGLWYFPSDAQDAGPIARGVLTSVIAEGLNSLVIALEAVEPN